LAEPRDVFHRAALFLKQKPNNNVVPVRRFLFSRKTPFDPRLRTHKIHRLSARYARTIYAAEIEPDLRVVFYIEDDIVVTVDAS
jgi:hypothetical protein